MFYNNHTFRITDFLKELHLGITYVIFLEH